jgi:carotenoid 1,2-hydratase
MTTQVAAPAPLAEGMPSANVAAQAGCEAGFDVAVPHTGYVWWYVDALSDDGRQGITLIAFVGSVFSPYYAWARRRDAGDPENFCALNVALYGEHGKHWTLTERGRGAVQRSPTRFSVGPSSLTWEGGVLTIAVDETTVPLPSRVRGRVRVTPVVRVGEVFTLDAHGRHRWRPIAPRARVEVEFTQPRVRWQGDAYLDSNAGDRPLETDFASWDWSRASLPDGGTAVLYDVVPRTSEAMSLALRIAASGAVERFAAPPRATLPGTLWRVARGTRAEAPHGARVQRTLEDTPFYARSVVTSQLLGTPVTAMHESLSLDRFRSPWVQLLLPFRMPRRAR